MPCRKLPLLAGFVALVSALVVMGADPPSGPAYQIVLRSRHAEVNPTRSKDAQTGGGSIVVEQPEPNTIVILMAGSAVVGSDCHQSHAAIDFNLDQELEVVPMRQGARRPLIGLIGRVVGTLQVTDPGCCGKPCGSAEQGVAAASLSIGDAHLLSVSVPTTTASCGQELAVNNRIGPVECPADVGCFHLSGSFHIAASEGKGVFNRQYAVADFDPAPQLDASWADALRPFRAVPRRDFGFKIALRVVEDPTPVIEEKKP
jgi:hypothetical protein